MNKQVNPNRYNRQYYNILDGESSYIIEKGYFFSGRSSTFKRIVDLIEIQPGNEVVDYGCGTGDLAFFLALKYHCKVKAIDYSKEAIDICNEKLNQVSSYSAQIKFINCNNNYIHDFKNIKVVFFCDVLEHMFDEEIEIVLEQVKKWNTNGKIKIAIHTDNNNYLKFINPFFNLLNILFRIKSLNQIKKDSKIDRELHVNLTTPKKLKNQMEKCGYKQLILKYTYPTEAIVKMQLGMLQNIPYLSKICVFILRKFIFLSPSFYAVYEKK